MESELVPSEMDIPNFEGMPEPHAILTLSWEDIWPSAQTYTQDHWKRDPTAQEIKEIFQYIIHKGLDCEDGTFWSIVSFRVEMYYEDDFCIKCGNKECQCGDDL